MKNISYASYKTFFKALSNKTRFEIIRCLRKGSMSVNEICKNTKFEQSRVSHNLKRLEKCGFINSNKKGKQRVYTLDKKYIVPALNNIDKYIARCSRKLNKCVTG